MNNSSETVAVVSNHLNYENVFFILLIIIGGIILYKIGDRLLNKMEEEIDLNLTIHYLLKDMIKFIIIVVGIAWILHILGINLEGLIISLGIIGIVIGIASQDIVSNFISGLFILIDNKVKVGDVIKVNDTKGTIKKVGFRNTYMINQDNYEIVIPNSVLSKNIHTLYKPTEDYRLRVEAVLPHGIDLYQFKEELDSIMYSYDWVVDDKTSFFSRDYTEWGPKVEVSYWIKDYENISCGKIRILENINRIADKYRKE